MIDNDENAGSHDELDEEYFIEDEDIELDDNQRRELARLYGPLVEQAQRLSQQLTIQLAPEKRRAIEKALGLQRLSDQAMKAWQQVFGHSLPELPDSITRNFPRNWPVRSLSQAHDLAFDAGIPVVWVPSSDALARLFELEADLRLPWLVANAPTEMAHARCVLTEITNPELRFMAESLVEATVLVEQGHWRGAQALAAVVIDRLLSKWLHRPMKWIDIHSHIKAHHELAKSFRLKELRYVMTIAAMHKVLTPADLDTNEPLPFSRHGTIHGISAQQYTPGNSVVGVLFAVSLLRQIQETQADHNQYPRSVLPTPSRAT